jgi:hypothetical protein
MARFKVEITPALVISVLALFVALGGGAYAALGKHSVGSPQLKPRAVKTGKLANRAVTSAKLRSGSVTKGKIEQGALGPQVVAYATVDKSGQVIRSRSRGITQANVDGGYPYAICFKDLPAFRSASVTAISPKALYVVTSSVQFDDASCPDGSAADLEVTTWIEERYASENGPRPYYSQEAFTIALLK